jgi:hypothetical protein
VGSKKKIAVIENGYDESKLKSVAADTRFQEDRRLKMAYAGSFFVNHRNPEEFLKALDFDRHSFIHIGRDFSGRVNAYSDKGIHQLGQIPYSETLSCLKAVDVGLIFSSGKAFESTTKVYDYIACGLDIIIVHPKDQEQGEIYNLVKDLKNVYWVENSADSIREFLKSYQPSNRVVGTNSFEPLSREFQLKKLINELQQR